MTEDTQTTRIKDLEARLAKAEEIMIAFINMLDAIEDTRIRALSQIVEDIHDFTASKGE